VLQHVLAKFPQPAILVKDPLQLHGCPVAQFIPSNYPNYNNYTRALWPPAAMVTFKLHLAWGLISPDKRFQMKSAPNRFLAFFWLLQLGTHGFIVFRNVSLYSTSNWKKSVREWARHKLDTVGEQ
jgi:hypothetical protein